MDLIQNINKISFIFFAFIGFVHIITGLMTVNSIAINLTVPINRICDIPFLTSALIYGLSGIRLKLPENKNINLAFILLCFLIILTALYINIAYPDANRFILN